jgi:hypothetical protein
MVGNNPSTCAIVEAMSLNVDLKDIYMLNINCGEASGLDKAEKLDSICRWLLCITDLLTLGINAGERSVVYQSKKLLGGRYLEIGPTLDLSIDSLEFEAMEKEADRIWNINKENILNTLKLSRKVTV